MLDIDRLRQVIRELGGTKSASEGAGVTRQQICRYVTKENEPTFSVVVKLSEISGRSLDWLAGRPDSAGVDWDALRDAALDVEATLADATASPDVERKLLRMAYDARAWAKKNADA